jgi:transcriptional regulator with XRE-family HTH domain
MNFGCASAECGHYHGPTPINGHRVMPRLNGREIKRLRKRRGWTQEDMVAVGEKLASKLNEDNHGEKQRYGLSLSNLSLAERGEEIGAAAAGFIALILGVEAVQLMQPDAGPPANSRPAGEEKIVEKLDLSHKQIQQLRKTILAKWLPSTGIRLRSGGFTLHDDEHKKWSRSTYAGFISAAFFFSEHPVKMSSTSGHHNTQLNMMLLGRHAWHLFNSGERDMGEPDPSQDLFADFDKAWQANGFFIKFPPYLKQLDRACPPSEPNSFYVGWLDFCHLLAANALLAEQNEIEREFEEYEHTGRQMGITYLRHFEESIRPGNEVFWQLVRTLLLRLMGAPPPKLSSRQFKKAHGFTIDEMFNQIQEGLELTGEDTDRMRKLIRDFEERNSGLEVALLKLESEFTYIGRPRESDGRIELKVARLPEWG